MKKKNFTKILYLLALMPFFKPKLLSSISVISNIYNIFQILVLLAFIMYCIKHKSIKISKIIFLIILMQFIYITSTLINKLDCSSVIINTVQVIILCILIENFYLNDKEKLYWALSKLLFILIFIDFIYVILHPTGVIVGTLHTWFLGAKNNHLTYILPAIFCNYVYYFYIKRSKYMKWIILAFICFISAYILVVVQSMTSLVALVLMILLILFNNKYSILNYINMKTISIVYLIIFIGVVFLGIQNHFSYFIEEVLNKDLTFTGRVQIWEKSIEYIKMKPLLGNGIETNVFRVFKFGDASAVHCHNMLLELIYQGGVLLLLIFIKFWNTICKKIDSCDSKIKPFLSATLLVYCIELLTEVYYFDVFIWILVLIYYSSNLLDAGDSKNES